MTIDIDWAMDDDAGIRCGDCGDSTTLSKLCEDVTLFTDKYICEANAQEVYALICGLEVQAWSLRQTYEKWKRNSFNKENK